MKILMRVYITMVILMGTASVAFAGVENAGQNAGEWIMDQIWWIALAIVAVMAVRFLVKKAWVPAVVFMALSAVMLFIISNPEKLKMIGESLFNIIFN